MRESRVCIIGAGASGIAAAKVLHEKGIPFDGFEKGSSVGGNWRYLNDNGQSSAYASLHINTSKTRMAFSDFPMPDDYPDYPHHAQIARYFDDYVDHFGFRDQITFRTEVIDVAPAGEGSWDVTLAGGKSRRYGAVLVANGHHWDPKWAHFPGRFDGLQMHSHDYKTPGVFAGRNVLVIGMGNSGVDIACESSRVAAHTFLSTRRSAHVIPKYIWGKPVDQFTTPFTSLLPPAVQALGMQFLLWLTRGPQSRYGVPVPAHKLHQAHPTISSELLTLIGHGRIKIKPNVKMLAGERVLFEDGSAERIDCIVHATGYKVSFPFFKPEVFTVQDNELPLYRWVVPLQHPNLYFIGFLQPLGAIMPLAELQAKWVAGLLTGACKLPGTGIMQREIIRERERMRRRYVASTRHTMQVDFFSYKRQIQRELRRR
ncbi:MAG: NAD(P)-binding domain-containing protein [candidate division KSB1 bacterium]|nr:NAD(P)-binding domain-containing protein [candidate division KSB1 bacterium]MDZ7273826.1 NAD(P)-binding domain-containing protein [candidate division KSB1 bacterium]MDZ7285982.1 NAD(P)-binding domain-containing protein [candidate division KSB1 bacterium]MDZ7299014.1 NAD(P)-binding domain-containing protein [candidate division KSB1 bacterium]MDZ7307983.1 NAD(P)-binding domain-containing protein [candidate division KSB1 bacterium]